MPSVSTVPPSNVSASPPEVEIGDVLNGGSQIQKYWNAVTGRRDGLSNVYHKLEHKIIPAGRIGNLWVASRRAIRQHVARNTGLAG